MSIRPIPTNCVDQTLCIAPSAVNCDPVEMKKFYDLNLESRGGMKYRLILDNWEPHDSKRPKWVHEYDFVSYNSHHDTIHSFAPDTPIISFDSGRGHHNPDTGESPAMFGEWFEAAIAAKMFIPGRLAGIGRAVYQQATADDQAMMLRYLEQEFKMFNRIKKARRLSRLKYVLIYTPTVRGDQTGKPATIQQHIEMVEATKHYGPRMIWDRMAWLRSQPKTFFDQWVKMHFPPSNVHPPFNQLEAYLTAFRTIVARGGN